MDEARENDDVDLHTRLLDTIVGRVIVGIILIVGSFWIVAPNMPNSAVRAEMAGWWEPAEDIGLIQDWAVFSPNPRNMSLDVRARVQYADGSIEYWDIPEYDPGFGAYRQYRWHKFQERIRLDDSRAYWPAFAQWVADQHERDGLPPETVTLIRRWIDHQPLTADGRAENSGWNEFEFYTWQGAS